MTLQISPSLLAADFARLGEEIKAVEPYADMIHLDIMDGHYVPNLTFGPRMVENLRPWTKLPFDVHLMISPVDSFLDMFAKAGADILTIHPEADNHPHFSLLKIKKLGCRAGLALNPGTPVEVLKPFLSLVDLVLVMTVNPGFGGQSFLKDQLPKIKEVRKLIDNSDRKILLEVDGGITPQTAPLVIEAGADVLVAGSAVFQGSPSSYKSNVDALRGKSSLV